MLRLLIVQLLALIAFCSAQETLTRDNFEEKIATGRSIVMFDDSATPSREFTTAFNSDENRRAGVKFFRVNCNSTPRLCTRFGRRNERRQRPFFILFDDGSDLAQYVNPIEINEILRGFRIADSQGLRDNPDYSDYSDYSIGRRRRGRGRGRGLNSAGSLGLLELGLLGGLGGFGGLPFGFF